MRLADIARHYLCPAEEPRPVCGPILGRGEQTARGAEGAHGATRRATHTRAGAAERCEVACRSAQSRRDWIFRWWTHGGGRQHELSPTDISGGGCRRQRELP